MAENKSKYRRKPAGYRKNADELLQMTVIGNLFATLFIAITGSCLLWYMHTRSAAVGFLIGAGIAALANIISWISHLAIERYFRRYQHFALPCAYVLKILLLFLILPIIKAWGFPGLDFLLLGFVSAILATLIVISGIVFTCEGPDFDIERKI